MAKMNIFITGASGFIGRNLTEFLAGIDSCILCNGSAGGKSRVTEKGGNGLAFEGSLHELAKEMEGVLSL